MRVHLCTAHFSMYLARCGVAVPHMGLRSPKGLQGRYRSRLQQIDLSVFDSPLDILGSTKACCQVCAKCYKLTYLLIFKDTLLDDMLPLNAPCTINNVMVGRD